MAQKGAHRTGLPPLAIKGGSGCDMGGTPLWLWLCLCLCLCL